METQQKKENSMAMPPLKEVVELYVKNEIHGIENKVDRNYIEITHRLNALENKVDRNHTETKRKIDETNQRITELRDDLRREMDLRFSQIDRNIDKVFKLMLVVLVAIATPTIARFIEAALKLLP